MSATTLHLDCGRRMQNVKPLQMILGIREQNGQFVVALWSCAVQLRVT
jgi:hypothetical protein